MMKILIPIFSQPVEEIEKKFRFKEFFAKFTSNDIDKLWLLMKNSMKRLQSHCSNKPSVNIPIEDLIFQTEVSDELKSEPSSTLRAGVR